MYRPKISIHGVCFYGAWGTLEQAEQAVSMAQAYGVYAIVEEQ